jgi:hypothetical protein
MDNINESPEPKKAVKFRQRTPEEQKIRDEQMKLAIQMANENAKAERWSNEGDIPHTDAAIKDIHNHSLVVADLHSVPENSSEDNIA